MARLGALRFARFKEVEFGSKRSGEVLFRQNILSFLPLNRWAVTRLGRLEKAKHLALSAAGREYSSLT